MNEKLEVFNDLKKDKSEHMTIIQDSEENREKLQITITNYCQKLKVDTENHETAKTNLREEIHKLQEDI